MHGGNMSGTVKEPGVGDLRGSVFELKGMVDYQAGSVVSREIIRQQTGTVTVFAFAAGQGLSEHTAPFDAMVVGLDGEAEIFIAGEPNRVAMGDMIIMPAGIPHAVKAGGRFKMLLVMIKK
jgi:quercetin dioxygenase-like cupin family protein